MFSVWFWIFAWIKNFIALKSLDWISFPDSMCDGTEHKKSSEKWTDQVDEYHYKQSCLLKYTPLWYFLLKKNIMWNVTSRGPHHLRFRAKRSCSPPSFRMLQSFCFTEQILCTVFNVFCGEHHRKSTNMQPYTRELHTLTITAEKIYFSLVTVSKMTQYACLWYTFRCSGTLSTNLNKKGFLIL